jgi:hypothetical protein
MATTTTHGRPVSPRYGLLCMAPNEWYVKDRLRSEQRQRRLIQPWPRERVLGEYCGLALCGRRFATREEADATRQ